MLNFKSIMKVVRPIIMLCMFLIFSASRCYSNELASIVYTSWRELCSISLKPFCLKSNKEFSSPAWNPDGTQIVVESGYHDGPRNLVIIKKDGTLLTPLEKSADFYRPMWSPDGKYIYALSSDLGNSIGRWDANGKKYKRVFLKGQESEYKFLQMISFSPSGNLAAVLTDHFKKMLIVEIQSDSIMVKKILPKNFSYVSQSVWEDENNILFVGKKGSTRGELWKVNIKDESIEKIGIDGMWLRDSIALSPDGKSVVFCAVADSQRTAANWTLWEYTLESSDIKKLTNGTEDVNPSWSRSMK